jgi:hypothetical protein
MLMRTNAVIPGTARKAVAGGGRVRPFEFCFLGFAAAAGSLLPAGECGSGASGGGKAIPAAAAVVRPAPPTPTPAPDPFASSVRPVLVAHCSPCHEPGGKLYAKLPFDDPSVVAGHSAGVLRRLKGEDREAVEKWLATLPAKTP